MEETSVNVVMVNKESRKQAEVNSSRSVEELIDRKMGQAAANEQNYPTPKSARSTPVSTLVGVDGDVVMATKGRWKGKAPRRTADKVVGPKAGGQIAPSTLGIALSKLQRKPKPRSIKDIDDTVWAASMVKAAEELKTHYGLQESIDDY